MNHNKLLEEIEKKPELLHKTNVMGENVLLFSVSTPDSFKILKEKGIDLKQTNKNFETVLTKLVNENNYVAVKYLLEEEGLGGTLNFANLLEKTPIFYAKTPEMLELLVEHGADINAIDADEKSILHKEWKYEDETNNDFALIEKIVELGVDPNARDAVDNTPIYYQIDVNIAEKLVSLGAKVKVFNKFEATPKSDYFKAHKKAMVKWFNTKMEEIGEIALTQEN